MSDECDHDAAQLEHHRKTGIEMEFWIICSACGADWTLTADLNDETAHIFRNEVEA